MPNRDQFTDDWFLSDRLLIRQPQKGFRAGTDSLLVSAAVQALPGQSVLELGAGVGVASLALHARVANLRVSMVELIPHIALMAQHNVATNSPPGDIMTDRITVVNADALRADLFAQSTFFDHSFCNPPFFDANATRPSQNASADLARRSEHSIAAWVKAMVRWTRSGGTLTMICRAGSITPALGAFERSAGAIEIFPILPAPDKPAFNTIIRAKKDSRAATKIMPPIVIRDQHGCIMPQVARIQRFGTEKI